MVLALIARLERFGGDESMLFPFACADANDIQMVLEENPKWEALARVLQEIEDDILTASQGVHTRSTFLYAIRRVVPSGAVVLLVTRKNARVVSSCCQILDSKLILTEFLPLCADGDSNDDPILVLVSEERTVGQLREYLCSGGVPLVLLVPKPQRASSVLGRAMRSVATLDMHPHALVTFLLLFACAGRALLLRQYNKHLARNNSLKRLRANVLEPAAGLYRRMRGLPSVRLCGRGRDACKGEGNGRLTIRH